MGKVYTSYNTGIVSTTSNHVGGIAGRNLGIVEDSYNTGSVSGHWFVGGITGSTDSNQRLERSYNTGTVAGTSSIGRISGTKTGIFKVNYYLSDTADLGFGSDSDVDGEVEAKTAAELKQVTTFVDWDFIEIWGIEENVSYPYL